MAWTRGLAFGAVLCACAAAEQPDDLVEEFVQQEGVDFRDCGEASFGNVCEQATPEQEVWAQCLRDAWEAGEPAMGTRTVLTIEGYNNPEWIFVRAAGLDPRVVLFTDWTRDPFGGCRFLRTDCDGLSSASACADVAPTECGEDQTLLERDC